MFRIFLAAEPGKRSRFSIRLAGKLQLRPWDTVRDLVGSSSVVVVVAIIHSS